MGVVERWIIGKLTVCVCVHNYVMFPLSRYRRVCVFNNLL